MPRAALGVAARVNVSVLYQFVDTATPPWPTSVAPRGGVFPGRAARGSVVPRKMACRTCRGGSHSAVQGHRLALEGQPNRCPFLIRSGKGRQDARPCFAHRPFALLRRRRLDFGLPYFGFGLFCARFSRRGPDVDQLILKRASASRLFGEWSDDDYDVLAGGIVVGRIMKAAAAPVGQPWLWTLAYGYHEDRTPTRGYAATREAAMAAFAKSWRRQ